MSKSVTKAWNRAERARRNRMIPTFVRLSGRHWDSFVTDLDTGSFQHRCNEVRFERESPFVCIEETPGVLR